MPEGKNNKGRLLALQKYFYHYTDENHPTTTQELIKAMDNKGYSANRKTILNVNTSRFELDRKIICH